MVVVAIDFGTSYSGWAFALRNSYQKNHDDIQTNSGWRSGEGLVTPKTPTCVLFDTNKNFHSFGYEAETKYAELLDEDAAEGWRYFSRFKMGLYIDEENKILYDMQLSSGRISTKQTLKDSQGQKMPALKVFSESIKFLKENFLNTLHERVQFIQLDDIHWILTVPAIWTDKAKQFMRMAATEAGIPGDLLTLAYEPEAAAVFCRDVTLKKKSDQEGDMAASFDPGDHFLVLDCGGGTVDITAYEIQENGKMKELASPSGGPWGAIEVNKNFMRFLKNLFGNDVWKQFEEKNFVDALELQRKFEEKKMIIGDNNTRDDVTMWCPPSLFQEYEQFSSTKFKVVNGISRVRDKLKFPLHTLMQIYEHPIKSIVNHVQEILQQPTLQNVKTILVVGGFSDCVFLRKRIQEYFSDLAVIHPNEAILSVLKGAVMYGFIPEIINERVCPRTYGIAVNIPFISGSHPESCKSLYDGREMCTDIFRVIARKGDPIIIGETSFECTCLPTRAKDTLATIELYHTSDVDPIYTFGNVEKFGTLYLDIPDIERGKNRLITVKIEFENTEIIVTALENGTNNKISRTFNCLQ